MFTSLLRYSVFLEIENLTFSYKEKNLSSNLALMNIKGFLSIFCLYLLEVILVEVLLKIK